VTFLDKLPEREHDIQRFTSVTEALRSVNKRLKEYKDQSHKPTVLVSHFKSLNSLFLH
jgi:hypothetical protein